MHRHNPRLTSFLWELENLSSTSPVYQLDGLNPSLGEMHANRRQALTTGVAIFTVKASCSPASFQRSFGVWSADKQTPRPLSSNGMTQTRMFYAALPQDINPGLLTGYHWASSESMAMRRSTPKSSESLPSHTRLYPAILVPGLR